MAIQNKRVFCAVLVCSWSITALLLSFVLHSSAECYRINTWCLPTSNGQLLNYRSIQPLQIGCNLDPDLCNWCRALWFVWNMHLGFCIGEFSHVCVEKIFHFQVWTAWFLGSRYNQVLKGIVCTEPRVTIELDGFVVLNDMLRSVCL